jgi:TRAP-type C4-dicarboxylate transport system permease small subunit
MKTFVSAVAFLSRLCGVAAALMLLAAVVVVCHMVVVRYVLQESTFWQTELVTYLLIATTFIGSPYVLLTRGHVNVDLLPMYLGHRGRMALAMFASVVALAFCLVAAWTGFELWLEAWEKRWLSETLWEVRMWIPYLTLPVGFGILSLQYLADIFSLIGGHEAPFGLAAEEGE